MENSVKSIVKYGRPLKPIKHSLHINSPFHVSECESVSSDAAAEGKQDYTE